MGIIGYGVCGPGEAERHLEETLQCFKRLTDKTIICLNHAGPEEEQLIKKYSCEVYRDNRVWGLQQNRIKESLVHRVAALAPERCLALDMDESLAEDCSRDDLEQLTYPALSFYFVQMWDDGYNPDLGFWSVRMWDYKPEYGLKFLNRPLQCGLAPAWTHGVAAYIPQYVVHYGLQKKEDRQRKVERYEKYDPDGKWLGSWYPNLKSNKQAVPFDPIAFRKELEDEVGRYGDQTKRMANPKRGKFYFFRNKNGEVLDIPERHYEMALANPKLTLVSDTPVEEGGSIPDLKRAAEDTVIRQDAKEPQEFICSTCQFSAKSAFGLGVHSRKHA